MFLLNNVLNKLISEKKMPPKKKRKDSPHVKFSQDYLFDKQKYLR